MNRRTFLGVFALPLLFGQSAWGMVGGMARKHIPIGSDVELDAEIAAKGGGGGGSLTPPVTLTGTDPTKAVLTLEANAAQTENVFRVYNKDGDLAVDVDLDGRLDALSIVVQTPPDTGGSPGSVIAAPGHARISRNDSAPALEIWGIAPSPNNAALLGFAAGHGAILELDPLVATDSAIIVVANVAQSANILEVWDNAFNVLQFAITPGGGVLFPAADPHVVGAWWDNAGTLTRSSG